MKNLLAFIILSIPFFACQSNTEKTPSVSTNVATDSAAVAVTIHGFFTWYYANAERLTHNFTIEKNGHLVLDATKFEEHLANIKSSGLVSEAFLAEERKIYAECARFWQYESAEEVPSCLDVERFACAQDGEPTWWTTSPIRIKLLGVGKVAATMYLPEDPDFSRDYELVKENGKWLLSKIDCQLLPTEAYVPEDFVVVNQKGEVRIHGEKVAFDKVKDKVQSILMEKYAILPTIIEPQFEGEVLMGTRQEIETQLAEAIAAAQAARK